jgi:hypothetical protein
MLRAWNEAQQKTIWLLGETAEYVEVKIRLLDILRVNVHIRGQKMDKENEKKENKIM